MSYHMEFKFSLDLANRDIKEMMDRMQMPVPVLTNAVVQTVTAEHLPEILTKEQTQAFVDGCKNVIEGTEIGDYVVVRARYIGMGETWEQEEEEDGNDKNH